MDRVVSIRADGRFGTCRSCRWRRLFLFRRDRQDGLLWLCRYHGGGCLQKDKEFDKAFRWFGNAAKLGDDYAYYKLGECCEQGRGTQSNAVEAANWYVQGANRGHLLCMEKAGDCYATGYGVEKDPAKARMWYEKAVKRGCSMTAARKLESLDGKGK